MKLKLGKRLLAAGMSLALSVGLLCSGAQAAGTVNTVAEKTGNDGSITVTVYNNTPSGTVGSGAQTTVSDAKPVEGVGINALRVGSVVELTSTDANQNVSTQVAFGLNDEICTLLGLATDNAIASQDGTHYFAPAAVQTALSTKNNAPDGQSALESYVANAGTAQKQTTGENGVVTFSGLNYGLYLLAKSALPADATTDLVPFLVSVPMYVESEGGNAWQHNVYAYPKVRASDIAIAKTAGTPGDDGYVSSGDTIPFTITTTIPASQTTTGTGPSTKFTSFVITDTNAGNTLDIATDSMVVKLGDTPLTKDTQYTVAATEGGFTVTLTDTASTGGLAALNANLNTQQTITVTYNATVATDVAFSTKLTNEAKLTYQRQGMSATQDVSADAAGTPATVDLYTYGLDLTKTLSDGAAIQENKISFELYKTNNDGTLSNPVPVKAGNGGYWVAASAASGTDTYAMYVGTDGKLNLYGLEPGTYYLKETATMQGYALLAEPITIVVTAPKTAGDPATVTVNNANAQVNAGVASLKVENTKNETGFKLPQTGGAGTLMVTAIGLGLLCAGVILLVVYRKKGEKNA